MPTVSSGRRLVHAAAVYTLGNFAQKGLLFLCLPFYAHVLSVNDYGRWSLFLALAAVFSIGFDLSLSRAIPRLYYEHWAEDARSRGYLFASFLQRIVLSVLAAIVFYRLSPLLLPAVSRGAIDANEYRLPLIAAGASDAFILYVCAAYRARQLPGQFVLLKLLQALSQIGGSFAALYIFGRSPARLAAGFALGSAIIAIVAVGVFLAWILSNKRAAMPFASTFRSNARFSAPLVFHETAAWLRNSADPFIIVHFLTLYSVSVYHIGYQFGLLVSLILFSVELALGPFLFEMMKTDAQFKAKYLEIVRLMVGGTFVLVVTLALFSREVVVLLFPDELAEAGRIAPIVAAGYFFHGLYTTYVRSFILKGRTAVVPLLTVGPTLLGIAASIVLTPRFGVVAPAVVTVGSFALLALIVYLAVRRIDDFAFPVRLHVALATVVMVVAVVASMSWTSSGSHAIVLKAVTWVVLLAASYAVFLRGRSEQLRTMIKIETV